MAAHESARVALEHRIQCAWKGYSGIRHQLSDVSQPLLLRVSLLDSVVLPRLLWRLELQSLNLPDRSRLLGVRRVMMGRCIRFACGPRQDRASFHQPRERVIPHRILHFSRGPWDAIQHYRRLNFFGHVCRLYQEHVVTDAARWRNLSWLRDFRRDNPGRVGGQPGRRAPNCGNPCRAELHVMRDFEAYIARIKERQSSMC